MQKARCVVFVALLLAGALAHAQKTELAVTFGAAVSPDGKGPVTCGEAILCQIPPGTLGPVSLGSGFSWQASLAYRLTNLKAAALYLELPVARSPSRIVPGSHDFSSFFFTPSAQVTLLPDKFASPFASIGGGLAHFGAFGSSGNTGAFQVGGGVDFRTPLRGLGIRAEARDFITGHPEIFPVGAFNSRVQHIFVGGGVVVKF
ncbi:MAG TPA: hypothetical protein VFP59_07895 [Candidatus Angelobacter sp.]|nr:hypothetical protein [Candidatus Angelobacter sp.]